MTLKEVDAEVAKFCKIHRMQWERNPKTNEYKFTIAYHTHLSSGINNGKRNYTPESVEKSLDYMLKKHTNGRYA